MLFRANNIVTFQLIEINATRFPFIALNWILIQSSWIKIPRGGKKRKRHRSELIAFKAVHNKQRGGGGGRREGSLNYFSVVIRFGPGFLHPFRGGTDSSCSFNSQVFTALWDYIIVYSALQRMFNGVIQ